MNIEEKNRRCDAVTVYYYPDRVGFLCRVYGRWVRDCRDCAFSTGTFIDTNEDDHFGQTEGDE